MEPSKHARILIVDDELSICTLLQNLFSSLNISSQWLTDPLVIPQFIRENPFDVCLLDIRMPDVNGLDLIPHISTHCPDGKVIFMTGHADKETAIQALKAGAFDFLEKPFDLDLLVHAVQRAFKVQEAERNQRKLVEALKNSQKELLQSKKRMEYLNEKLMETNKALSVLAQNIALEREQVERQIAFKLKSLVIPVINKLKLQRGMEKFSAELQVLVNQIIGDLTSGFSRDPVIMSNLSPTELRIASLIRNGLTTEEIADQLTIAPSTVRTHRKNIRKKLNINDTHFSLKNFLLAKSKNTGKG